MVASISFAWSSLGLSTAGLVKAGEHSSWWKDHRDSELVSKWNALSKSTPDWFYGPQFRDPKKAKPWMPGCSYLSQFEVRFLQTNGLEKLLMRRFILCWPLQLKNLVNKKRTRIPTCDGWKAVQANLVFASHAWPKTQVFNKFKLMFLQGELVNMVLTSRISVQIYLKASTTNIFRISFFPLHQDNKFG